MLTKNNKIKIILILSLISLILLSVAYADESAKDRIIFFNQYKKGSEEYNKIKTKTSEGKNSVLGSNGCSIFAGLHADQW